MSRSVEQLIKEIRETDRIASTDMETVHWSVRPGVEMARRQAQESLETLRKEYVRRVRCNTTGVFVFGSAEEQKQFAAFAAEEVSAFGVQADALYQRLADKVEPSCGPNREFGVTQLQGLIQGLREATKELDVRDMTRPVLADLVVCPDRTALVETVRGLVRKAVGDDLARIAIDRAVNDAAVAAGFCGAVLPVVVLGAEADEVAGLASLFTNTSSVELGATEVTKEFVMKQFPHLKAKLKKPKP